MIFFWINIILLFLFFIFVNYIRKQKQEDINLVRNKIEVDMQEYILSDEGHESFINSDFFANVVGCIVVIVGVIVIIGLIIVIDPKLGGALNDTNIMTSADNASNVVF